MKSKILKLFKYIFLFTILGFIFLLNPYWLRYLNSPTLFCTPLAKECPEAYIHPIDSFTGLPITRICKKENRACYFEEIWRIDKKRCGTDRECLNTPPCHCSGRWRTMDRDKNICL